MNGQNNTDNLPYEQVGDAEPVCIADEVPFEIPDTWEWVRLGTIFQHNTGKALNSSNHSGSKQKYITTSNLYWGRFELEKLKEMYFTDDEVEKCTATNGDLLVCEGGDIGRSAIWHYDYDICIQNHIHRLRAYSPVCTEYFYFLFYLYKFAGWIGGKGIGIQGLSSNAIHALLFPFPPLSEQNRIVCKIRDIMPLLESYDVAYDENERLNSEFPDKLKKSILQQAVMGKLVPQDPNYEPASVLLERIRAEKERLITEGKIKRDKHESVIYRRDNSHYEKLDGVERCIDDEIPFEIPESWCWVRLGAISDILSGYAFKSDEFKKHGRYKLFRGINLGVGIIRWDDTVYVDFIPDSIHIYKLNRGDVLLGLDRPWISGGIRVEIFDSEQETFLVQRVLRLRETGAITKKYIATFLRSDFFRNAAEMQTTGISVPHISQTQVEKALVPLPPLIEQHRIVEKIEETLPKIKVL